MFCHKQLPSHFRRKHVVNQVTCCVRKINPKFIRIMTQKKWIFWFREVKLIGYSNKWKSTTAAATAAVAQMRHVIAAVVFRSFYTKFRVWKPLDSFEIRKRVSASKKERLSARERMNQNSMPKEYIRLRSRSMLMLLCFVVVVIAISFVCVYFYVQCTHISYWSVSYTMPKEHRATILRTSNWAAFKSGKKNSVSPFLRQSILKIHNNRRFNTNKHTRSLYYLNRFSVTSQTLLSVSV